MWVEILENMGRVVWFVNGLTEIRFDTQQHVIKTLRNVALTAGGIPLDIAYPLEAPTYEHRSELRVPMFD